MKNRYIQMEILLCLLDCQRHTLNEIKNKTGYSKETIRQHVQIISMFLPLDIYRSGKAGVQGGGGIILQKNFLLNILFTKGEIDIILQKLEGEFENPRSKKLKEKIESMQGKK